MKHNLSCDCPACIEKQLQADRFLYAIGLGSLILISAAGYLQLLHAGLFSFLSFTR